MKNRKIAYILLVMLMLTVFTTPVSASEYTRTMKFTDRGDDVLRLQKALNSQGYYNYHIDGIYGKRTENAVIKFQIDNKIRIDGFAGP